MICELIVHTVKQPWATAAALSVGHFVLFSICCISCVLQCQTCRQSCSSTGGPSEITEVRWHLVPAGTTLCSPHKHEPAAQYNVYGVTSLRDSGSDLATITYFNKLYLLCALSVAPLSRYCNILLSTNVIKYIFYCALAELSVLLTRVAVTCFIKKRRDL